MIINNNNPLDLSGADGENITVDVEEAGGNPLLVSYTLNGRTAALSPNGTSDSFSFPLRRSDRDPTLLTILFTFGDSNGHYDIAVSGDRGNQVSHFAVVQRFHIPGNAITYTFDIT